MYNARRGHVPQISISDDSHHITEAIGSYYGSPNDDTSNGAMKDSRPLSFITTQNEAYDTPNGRRYGSYGDMKQRSSPPKTPLARTSSNERVPTSPREESGSPKSLRRMGSLGAENANGTPSRPPLHRDPSSETAVQPFPLNDIDYESSPAAVAQELSNLQAIRRMSMNVDLADPDLPSYGGLVSSVPTQAPSSDDDEDDPSKLFWVPARLHPELAPKEFKTFVEDRVDRIRRRSGGEDTLSPDGMERSPSSSSSLRRKKSMLSHSIDTKGNYEDGAERLERKRSRRMQMESQTTVADLHELENLVNDPAQLMRRLSLDTSRKSQDSGVEVPASEDMPILPPGGPALKRSTRTTYRKGSLRRGERVPFSKRALNRHGESEGEESSAASPITPVQDEPILGLTRVQTEPSSAPSQPRDRDAADQYGRPSSRRGPNLHGSQSSDNLTTVGASAQRRTSPQGRKSPPPPVPQVPAQHHQQQQQQQRAAEPPPTSQPQPRPSLDEEPQGQRHPNAPQPRQFHSRIASSGRTTAQLPGYNNTNPLPHVIETLPDGTKIPVQHLSQQQHQFPERKSSIDQPRPRGGAHMRPVPGRERSAPSSTLDDISSRPSPLPGSGGTRTDALTMVPTFEEKKVEKKDGGRKSSWKWILGNDDEEKERRSSKEERRSSEDSGSVKSGKASKLSKNQDKTRLDLLQNSIDGTTPAARGRESVVLNREDLNLDTERKKESKKANKASKEDKEAKEPGLLSAIFGGKKKTSDTDLKEKKRKSDRAHSHEPPIRILKPDIDYNWTRFSILEERAIYRMAHIKLANPRRALYSQVLLSNFMYSYLAKVQMMHPQMQIPASPQQKAAQQRKKEQEAEARKQQEQNQPAEYSQYQRWQEVRQSSASASSASASAPYDHAELQQRADSIMQQQSRQDAQQQSAGAQQRDYDDGSGGYDGRTSEEMIGNEWPDYRSSGSAYNQQFQSQPNGKTDRGAGGGDGYSVAGTHDYLGYGNSQQSFSTQAGLWDDEEKAEDLW